MPLRKLIYCLFLFLGLSCLLAVSVFAEEKKVIAKKEDHSAEIKAFQEQQQKAKADFELKKKELQEELQKILKNYKDGKLPQELIKANNQKQEELRKSFQDQMRKLQAQERKLRLGRETLDRPLWGGKQVEVYNKALDEKQKRLEFQKRREAQDQILRRDRQEEQKQSRQL